jgi:hypothetical protein
VKKIIFLLIFLVASLFLRAQFFSHDSITISRFIIKDESFGPKWKDTLIAGYPASISGERTAWVSPPGMITDTIPAIISLTERIETNGTGWISRCFIPRHSINYYKDGKIVRYLLVCFECSGVEFSDDKKKVFVKDVQTRLDQMSELRSLFKDLLKEDDD